MLKNKIILCFFCFAAGCSAFASQIKPPLRYPPTQFPPYLRPGAICAKPLWCGRFGNHLIGYIEARWIAYLKGAPFFYIPFPYSEELTLSQLEMKDDLMAGYQKVDINDWPTLCSLKLMHNKTYISHLPTYLTEDLIKTMRVDACFLNLMRQSLTPLHPEQLHVVTPPSHLLSVAVHLRKGTTYDPPCKSVQIFNRKYEETPKPDGIYVDKKFPMKVPPEQYYIDQILQLSQLFNHQEMYVFIFTDDPEPIKLKERIEEAVNLPNIRFDCREKGGASFKVLDDFFSMKHFNILIRPKNSTFTQAIELIGDFQIVVYPTSYHWETDEEGYEYLWMDNVKLIN